VVTETSDHNDEVEQLRRTILAHLKVAASHGRIEGIEALGILVRLAARLIASVEDEDERKHLVYAVTEDFPSIVQIEREVPDQVTWQ
jgi:hypothetical protein